MKKGLLFFLLFVSFLLNGQNLEKNTTGSFTFIPTGPLSSKPIKVFYHIPDGDITTMPIIMSFHGASRNADDYRDYWIQMANSNNFMVFAPEFSSANFPGGDAYNLANVFDDGDNPSQSSFNSINEWTFSVIDPIFETIKADISGTQQNYNAWGHSAGSQFLQRFILYLPNSKLDIAVCSNAGWYTVPEFGVDFPYGIDLSLLSIQNLTDAFNKRVIVHLGQNDTNPNSPGLRHNTIVDNQQGLNRLVRGQYFFTTSQETALDLDVNYNWDKDEVSGVAHNAQLMANDALQHILNSSLSTNNSIDSSIIVFPNPVINKRLTISSQSSDDKQVVLYNILGKKIFTQNFSGTRETLDLNSVQSGLYILKVIEGSKISTQKLIID